MNVTTKLKPFGTKSQTLLTDVSVLTLAGQRFGFPQGNNFGAILMDAGTKVSRDGKSPGKMFWFPVDRVFNVKQGAVKFRSNLRGYFFGLYGNEDTNEFSAKNPNLLTARVVSLNEALCNFNPGYEPPYNAEGDRAIATMLVPVIAGMPADAAHAMGYNLTQARDWFFWPHGVSDSRQDEYAGNRVAAKAEALNVAREYLEKAHEIYSRYVPKAPENHWGERPWQLPQFVRDG